MVVDVPASDAPIWCGTCPAHVDIHVHTCVRKRMPKTQILVFVVPPLVAGIQRKLLFTYWLSRPPTGARHPRMLAFADLVTTITSITQGLYFGVSRLVFIVGIAGFNFFNLSTLTARDILGQRSGSTSLRLFSRIVLHTNVALKLVWY